MQTEIEAKFININSDDIRRRLKNLDAKLVHPELLMKRKVFDYPDERLNKVNGWIRVRDEGNEVTLSYKQLNDRTLHGTKEISVKVDDFENSCNLLLAMGLKLISYQETKREKWLLSGNEVTIDTWPWIPTFLEIEGPEEKSLKEVAKKLGLQWSEAMHGSVETVYQKDFKVTEDEINSWESITFIPIPDWLEIKRK